MGPFDVSELFVPWGRLMEASCVSEGLISWGRLMEASCVSEGLVSWGVLYRLGEACCCVSEVPLMCLSHGAVS